MLQRLQRLRWRDPRFVAMIVAFALGIFILAQPVHAASLVEFGTQVLYDLIIWPFIQVFNFLLILLIKVAEYNNFADEPIVVKGWKIVRDVSNMFFVFILLVIAIATIVKWSVINYRDNLRRLVLMAVIINFSRTIVVFFIDLSQAIVLTFIDAIANAAQAGGLILLGLDQLAFPAGATGVAVFNLATYLIAAIMILVATVIVGAITLIFVVRITALWALIIFAPLAFLASALPQSEQWYKRWWQYFTANLTSGPVLAFMLWLAFAIVSQGGALAQSVDLGSADLATLSGLTISRYLFGISILVYSVRLAVTVGGEGGKLGAAFAGKMGGFAKSAGRYLQHGKSGEGGILGRAKSAGLGVTAGLAGAAGSIPLIGAPMRALERAATVAREKRTGIRSKAEGEMLARLSPPQRAQAEEQTFLGMRIVSMPRRKAIIERKLADEFTKKDENNEFIVDNETIGRYRRDYDKFATSEELKDFDKKVGLRGLRDNQGAFVSPEAQRRTMDMMTELLPQGLTRDIIKVNPEESLRLLEKTSTRGQLTSEYKKLGPQERAKFINGAINLFKEIGTQLNGKPTPDEKERLTKQQSKLRGTIINMDGQEAIDKGVASFDEAIDQMDQESHNDIKQAYLDNKANEDAILKLTGMNFRRLVVSGKLDKKKKDTILKVVIDAHNRGEAEAENLITSSDTSLVRSVLNDYLGRHPGLQIRGRGERQPEQGDEDEDGDSALPGGGRPRGGGQGQQGGGGRGRGRSGRRGSRGGSPRTPRGGGAGGQQTPPPQQGPQQTPQPQPGPQQPPPTSPGGSSQQYP